MVIVHCVLVAVGFLISICLYPGLASGVKSLNFWKYQQCTVEAVQFFYLSIFWREPLGSLRTLQLLMILNKWNTTDYSDTAVILFLLQKILYILLLPSLQNLRSDFKYGCDSVLLCFCWNTWRLLFLTPFFFFMKEIFHNFELNRLQPTSCQSCCCSYYYNRTLLISKKFYFIPSMGNRFPFRLVLLLHTIHATSITKYILPLMSYSEPLLHNFDAKE